MNFFQSFLIEKSAELSYALLNLKLEIVNALGFAFHFARPPNPSPAKRDEDRIPFELIQEYTASWENGIYYSIQVNN